MINENTTIKEWFEQVSAWRAERFPDLTWGKQVDKTIEEWDEWVGTTQGTKHEAQESTDVIIAISYFTDPETFIEKTNEVLGR